MSEPSFLSWPRLQRQVSQRAGAVPVSPADRAFFENRVRPVLVKHCYECHSAGAKKVGGKLLLDTPEGMRKGGES